jgi:hypothetical protein
MATIELVRRCIADEGTTARVREALERALPQLERGDLAGGTLAYGLYELTEIVRAECPGALDCSNCTEECHEKTSLQTRVA